MKYERSKFGIWNSEFEVKINSAIRTPQFAFSLVELVIVIVIIGIIAAIAVPRFSSATETAQAKQIATNLRIINDAIELFRADHGFYPGKYSDEDISLATQTKFILQLTETTNADGQPGIYYGPYLRSIPFNPFSSRQGNPNVQIVFEEIVFPDAYIPQLDWLVGYLGGHVNANLHPQSSPTLCEVVQVAQPAQIIYGTHPYGSCP